MTPLLRRIKWENLKALSRLSLHSIKEPASLYISGALTVKRPSEEEAHGDNMAFLTIPVRMHSDRYAHARHNVKFGSSIPVNSQMLAKCVVENV